MLRYLGMRKEECRLARIDDLDFSKQEIRIRGKGGKIDIAPLPAQTIPALERCVSMAKALKCPWLLPSREGKPIGKSGLHRLWKRILENAGLPQVIRIHDARHSYAVGYLESGESVKTIQLLLRHASLATTETYLRGLDEERLKRNAVNRRFGVRDETDDHGNE